MTYKEYKEYIKDMTREELIAECLSLKANYDKSCRSWSYTESIRTAAMHTLDRLYQASQEMCEALEKKYQKGFTEYMDTMKEQRDYYDSLDNKYLEDMIDE